MLVVLWQNPCNDTAPVEEAIDDPLLEKWDAAQLDLRFRAKFLSN
jgi:hypothetical protein